MRLARYWMVMFCLLLVVSFVSGCREIGDVSGGEAAATPDVSSSPGQAKGAEADAIVTATPGVVESSDVKPGEGQSVDDSGGVSVAIKVWTDKYEGKPFGRGEAQATLVPDFTPLPGLLKGIKGMKKGGVRRLAMAAGDLFGELPAGAPIPLNQKFFIEVAVKDVFAKEPFDIKTVKQGQGGKEVAKGDAVRIHFSGRTGGFDSKSIFESSKEMGAPFVFRVGTGSVIEGLEQGVMGMKKGEVRRLSIPHYLGYGEKAQGDKVPAKSRLFYEVELLDFVVPGKLVQKTTKAGSGKEIASGEVGSFHYTGWLDGFNGKKKFDSSKDRNQPFSVQLGAGQVIEGWDQGLVGMKPGEVRQLEIPYNLAYGEQGRPPQIPAFATLYFEVEYLGQPKPEPSQTPAATPTPGS